MFAGWWSATHSGRELHPAESLWKVHRYGNSQWGLWPDISQGSGNTGHSEHGTPMGPSQLGLLITNAPIAQHCLSRVCKYVYDVVFYKYNFKKIFY